VSIETRPGEVWAVDFGLAAKQRPVLILAYPQPEDARALVVVVPLTSSYGDCGEKWTLANPVGFPSAPQ
jgi:mRNA-degrading endonuclease toxin of MazEF toxin-antitoxin module